MQTRPKIEIYIRNAEIRKNINESFVSHQKLIAYALLLFVLNKSNLSHIAPNMTATLLRSSVFSALIKLIQVYALLFLEAVHDTTFRQEKRHFFPKKW